MAMFFVFFLCYNDSVRFPQSFLLLSLSALSGEGNEKRTEAKKYPSLFLRFNRMIRCQSLQRGLTVPHVP